MSCNYCGKIHIDKPCPSGYTTTTTTEDPVLCPPKPLCDDLFNSHCIYYTGDDIECAGIAFGDNINNILSNLIAQLQACCLPTTTTTTTTINCSNPGGTVDPIYTTTTTLEPYFLVCCSSAQTTELQITELPRSQPGYVLGQVYQNLTEEYPTSYYIWIVASLSDIQSLGYSGANITYTPDWNRMFWMNNGEGSLEATLVACNDGIISSAKCPEPLITTTTTSTTSTTSTTTTTTIAPTTTTTTTIWCQEYNIYNNTAGPLNYGYVTCEGLVISNLVIPSGLCLSVFAQEGSLIVDPGITTGFGECTTTTTSTSTTTTSSTTTTTTIIPSELCFTIVALDATTTTTSSTTTSTTTTTISPTTTTTTVLPEESEWLVRNADCGGGTINDASINGVSMISLIGNNFPLTSTQVGFKLNPSGINYGGPNTIQCNVTTNLPGVGNCAVMYIIINGVVTPANILYFTSNPFPQITGVVINTGDTVEVRISCFGGPCP